MVDLHHQRLQICRFKLLSDGCFFLKFTNYKQMPKEVQLFSPTSYSSAHSQFGRNLQIHVWCFGYINEHAGAGLCRQRFSGQDPRRDRVKESFLGLTLHLCTQNTLTQCGCNNACSIAACKMHPELKGFLVDIWTVWSCELVAGMRNMGRCFQTTGEGTGRSET